MLIDSRDLAGGTELRADVCIVGSGPAGATIALELEGSGLDVLVLEAGGLDVEPEQQDLYEAEMTGEVFGSRDEPVPVSQTRLRTLGGTSQHWSGFCRPLRPVDLEPRPELGRPGWPISYDELSQHYERAAEILQLGPARFDHGYWSDAADIGPVLVDDDVVETVVFQISDVRFGSTYRPALDAARDVRVITHMSVTGIVPDESGRTVDRLEVATVGGKRFTVRARRLVIATGGIETPRLLLASAPGRGGVGNDSDEVGRGFCEHGQGRIAIGVLSRTPEEMTAYNLPAVAAPAGRVSGDDLRLQAALLLSDETVRKEGIMGVEAQLLTVARTEAEPEILAGIGLGDVTDLVPTVDGTGTMASFLVIGEQARHPESRITLGDAVDGLGMPRPRLHWVVSDDDRRSYVRGVELMAQRLGAAGVGRMQLVAGAVGPNPEGEGFLGRMAIDAEAIDPTDFPLLQANHHCCTVPMSADPSSGVVDRDLKVWGFEDLHLAGSGVFPTAGVTSPTISIVALSVRLAQHLQGELS